MPVKSRNRKLSGTRQRAPGLFLLLLFAALGVGCGTAEKTIETTPEPRRTASTAAEQRVLDWQALIRNLQSASTEDKLLSVNEFFNRLEFVDDSLHWGKEDYWATPVEMLMSNGGDCEDFTIAKFFTLQELRIPESRMRLTYVKSLTLNQPHMVLSYYRRPESEPLVLDNLTDFILPASQRTDLVPVYSFNGQGLWLAKQRGQGQFVGDSDRLSLWRELLHRMEQEKANP